MTPRRRLLVFTAIAVLVIVLLAAVPAYFASRPDFFSRYPRLAASYTDWADSKHKDVPCQSCHAAPTLAGQAGYSARMVGEFYLSLASVDRTPGVFAAPTNAACQVCHAQLVTTSPAGDLIIPHKAHVDVLKLECATCHRYLVHELSPKGTHTPPMAACLVCHDGRQAKNACVTCHTAKAAPETHKATDWLRVHADRQAGADCPSCHAWTPDWCADCHLRRPPSHVVTWRTTHPAAVSAHRNCEVCHTASDCIRCHGVVPKPNFDPSIKLVR
jgi:hypothetical protein